jgi:hypothetical protein
MTASGRELTQLRPGGAIKFKQLPARLAAEAGGFLFAKYAINTLAMFPVHDE